MKNTKGGVAHIKDHIDDQKDHIADHLIIKLALLIFYAKTLGF